MVVRRFPLLRGFARWPVSLLSSTSKTITEHLLAETTDPVTSPLICTVPYFASVAERWPGPVVYWLTDRIERYAGVNARTVHALDRRMCSVATLVCPNSARLADYLCKAGNCPTEKVRIIPNATRAANLLPAPPLSAGPLPEDISDLDRPVVGVIGNLASNMDWVLLLQMIRQTQDLTWVFVGPAGVAIHDAAHRNARRQAMLCENARFVGRKAYGALAAYAKAFDVAVLPYRFCEPTYSGSSTRFYEHLASCRPMLATYGFEELLHKEPLLTLFRDASEGVRRLQELRATGFQDDFIARRWQESLDATWQARAAYLLEQLAAVTGIGFAAGTAEAVRVA